MALILQLPKMEGPLSLLFCPPFPNLPHTFMLLPLRCLQLAAGLMDSIHVTHGEVAGWGKKYVQFFAD